MVNQRLKDGRSPAEAGSGLRPFGVEPAAPSQAEPLVPNAIAQLQWLIQWCEAAPGPDLRLDRAIDEVVGGDRCSFWSKSLDDALKLLPPPADWRRLTSQGMAVYAANPYNANAQKRIDGWGATPPLQMCAAALKLRLEPLLKAQAIEARRAATAKTGAVEDESPIGAAETPNTSQGPNP